jgi:hypothetical protein
LNVAKGYYVVRSQGFGDVHLNRKEAVALLKELGDKELVSSFTVIIQQKTPDIPKEQRDLV